MKKYERINHYLTHLLKHDPEQLKTITWQQLSKAKQLEDIGQRTIINILKSFRSEHGLPLPDKINGRKQKRTPSGTSKKAVVDNYLTKLMNEISLDELFRMTGKELCSAPELSNFSKTTVATTLSEFKRRLLVETGNGLNDTKPSDKSYQKPSSSETTDLIYTNVADNIRRIKSILDLTQSELSQRLGVSVNELDNLSNKKRLSSFDFLHRLHFVLGVNLDSFLFNDGDLFTNNKFVYNPEFQAFVSTIDSLNRYIKVLEDKVKELSGG